MSFFFLMNNEIIIIIYLSSPLLWLFRDDETNNLKCRNITWLKISTGRRRTSWLFYKGGRGFEIGTTKNKFLPTGDCWVCRSLYPDLTLATPLNMIFSHSPARSEPAALQALDVVKGSGCQICFTFNLFDCMTVTSHKSLCSYVDLLKSL